MNAVAMIASCMQHQPRDILEPAHGCGSLGSEIVAGHADALARVADEGVVDGARNWSEREAVVNDAGQVVEPAVVPLVVVIAGDGRCR